MKIDPYLYFDGDCEEAVRFYADLLGGEVLMLDHYDAAPEEETTFAGDAERVMHTAVSFGETTLMASDVPASYTDFTPGEGVQLSIAPDGLDESRRVFDALAEGGTVMTAFDTQFWGAWFGSLRDRWGIHWIVSHAPDPEDET